jgi:transketolase
MGLAKKTNLKSVRTGPESNPIDFDVALARKRCLKLRRRILEMSQSVSALHIAGAYSCLEMVDTIYFGLMRKKGGSYLDTFLLSKGHGCLSQYTILEELGVLSRTDIEQYCKPGGRLGTHPDYGVPGIEASTGSLGHGMGLAVGMAYADKSQGIDRTVYAVLSDGELQEGSVWENMMVAPSIGVTNIVAMVDLNDFQSLGRTSETLPNFYPVLDKVRSFGWEAVEVNGHDAEAIYRAVQGRKGGKPFMLIGKTIKGKGVSYMENVPLWHYRSPNPEEFKKAMAELKEVSG